MVDIYEYYQTMQSKNILLAYKGNVSEELFDSLLQTAEEKLNIIEPKSKVRKRVFNILIEILQNIFHHLEGIEDERNQEILSIVFLLNKIDSDYQIITGNHLLKANVEVLREKIDLINEMSEDELKDKYLETLFQGDISSKGGAGLGIIDIARRSGEKIVANFRPVNDKYSFFSLEVKICA